MVKAEEQKIRKFYRSRTNKKFAGVCGGLADYFEVDSKLVRLAFVTLGLVGGASIIFYVLALAFVPAAEE